MATRQGGGDAREPGGSEQLPRGDSEQLPRSKVCWRSLRVAGLCVGVDGYQHMSRLQNAVRDAEAVNKELKRMKGRRSSATQRRPLICYTSCDNV